MNPRPACPGCSAEQADWLLCKKCVGRLRRDLDALPELMRELTTTLTRQSQTGTGNGGKGSETPLPFDQNASQVRDTVINTLGTWIRELDLGDFKVAEHYQVVNLIKGGPLHVTLTRYVPVASNVRAWCRWLWDRAERIRGHEAASEIMDEIAYSVRIVRQAIDARSERVYGGQCEACSGEVYGLKGSESGICRHCKVVVSDMSMRRAQIEVRVRNAVADKATILAAVPEAFGVRLSDTQFRKWISRGKLRRAVVLTKHYDDNIRVIPVVYRVDTVLGLIAATATRAAS